MTVASFRLACTGFLAVALPLIWVLTSFQSHPLEHENSKTETIAGIPVYSHSSVDQGRRLRQDQEEVWVIVLRRPRSGGSSETARRICASASNCVSSNSRFTVVRATKKELEKLLEAHGEEIDYAEADGSMSVIPVMPPEHREPSSNARQAPQARNVKSWGLDRIDARLGLDDSYTVAHTGKGVHVYVLDTGIRTTHQTFEGRAIPTLEVLNGPLKLCNGDPTCANDRFGHGTHCAGTVGGKEYGVARGVTLHAVKVLADDGSGSWSSWAEALNWVVENGTRPAVVSSSMSGRDHVSYRFMQGAVQDAVDNGVTVVVAAGNNGYDACQNTPARIPQAVTVGATDRKDVRSDWGADGSSNYGRCLNFFAPGTDITSAGVSSDVIARDMNGSSMATPHVAGAVALLLQQSPTLTPNEIKAALRASATHGVVTDRRGSVDRLLFVGQDTTTTTTTTATTATTTTITTTTTTTTTVTTTTTTTTSTSTTTTTIVVRAFVVEGLSCSENDCYSIANCPVGAQIVQCASFPRHGGDGIHADLARCTARGGSRRRKEPVVPIKAVAVCSTFPYQFGSTYVATTGSMYVNSQRATAACYRGGVALSCYCHSSWMDCPETSWVPNEADPSVCTHRIGPSVQHRRRLVGRGAGAKIYALCDTLPNSEHQVQTVWANSCSGDDCSSVASCPSGTSVIECASIPANGGDGIQVAGTKCTARGSSSMENSIRGVAVCSRSTSTYSSVSSSMFLDRQQVTASCSIGRALSCFCHSLWTVSGVSVCGSTKFEPSGSTCTRAIPASSEHRRRMVGPGSGAIVYALCEA